MRTRTQWNGSVLNEAVVQLSHILLEASWTQCSELFNYRLNAQRLFISACADADKCLYSPQCRVACHPRPLSRAEVCIVQLISDVVSCIRLIVFNGVGVVSRAVLHYLRLQWLCKANTTQEWAKGKGGSVTLGQERTDGSRVWGEGCSISPLSPPFRNHFSCLVTGTCFSLCAAAWASNVTFLQKLLENKGGFFGCCFTQLRCS